MRLLTFCPYLHLHPESWQSILRQSASPGDVLFSHDNPYGDPWVGDHRNIQHQYERMRLTVLAGFDKVWIVESDMIVPEDALEKLSEVDAPVVSGVYRLRHGGDHPNLSDANGNVLTWEKLRRAASPLEVGGGAMGCLLVDRSALEGFSFLTGGNSAPDGPFMRHLRANGIKQVARIDVQCGHISPTGETLWPRIN